jgi:predicted TIM-barrel fold metal-dependent hydrolase
MGSAHRAEKAVLPHPVLRFEDHEQEGSQRLCSGVKELKRIDVHAHAFPPRYQITLEKALGRRCRFRSDWEWDEDRYLREMDRWGINTQILSLSQAYEHFENAEVAVDLCRTANDEYGEICAGRPERFRMFALIPLIDLERACEELERASKIPGYSGLALATHVRGKMLDDATFAPFFELANHLHTVIFLHPLARPLPEEWSCYRLEHLIGLPVDTTFALSRLALSGFLDRYTSLRVIAAHVGGTLPYLAPRIERAYRGGNAKLKPSDYFRTFFYDTSGPTHEAILACVARMFGPDKIVFGTDYPFGLGQEGMQYIEHAIWTVEHMGVPETALERIFSQNAHELLGSPL